jgi:hypothetical protein
MANLPSAFAHPAAKAAVILGKMLLSATMLGYAAAYFSRGFLDDNGRQTAWVVGSVVGLALGPCARIRFGGFRGKSGGSDPRPHENAGGRPAGRMFSFGMGALVGFLAGLVLGGLGMLAYYSWGESPWSTPVESDDATSLWILFAPGLAFAALGAILFSLAAATGKATRH